MKLLPLILILLTSCHNTDKTVPVKEKPKVENSEKTIADTEANVAPPPVFLNSKSTEQEILNHFTKRRNDLISLLQKATPKEADKLYEDFKKENDSALVLLGNKKSEFLETFNEKYIRYEGNDFVMHFPKDIQPLIKKYSDAGLEFWDIGEAITEIRMKPDYYLKLFGGKVSEDYKQYISNNAEEEKVLFSSDASIAIPWKDVGNRVAFRERFLQNFPNSPLHKTIREELSGYRYAYLLGYDNTQTNEQGAFFKENLDEFARFAKENPDSETVAIIKEMLAKKRTGNELQDFVKTRVNFNGYYP